MHKRKAFTMLSLLRCLPQGHMNDQNNTTKLPYIAVVMMYLRCATEVHSCKPLRYLLQHLDNMLLPKCSGESRHRNLASFS